MMSVPNLQTVQSQYAVNRQGQQEGIWAPLYDYITYPNAGSTVLTFFQTPNGQSSKTIVDTNMDQAGLLAAPKQFLVTGVEVLFMSSLAPARTGANIAGALIAGIVNDVHAVGKSGILRMTIGSKDYIVDGPLMKFPSPTRLAVAAAVATTAATETDIVEYASFAGQPYDVPPFFIPPVQNFKVTLEFPTAVALVSASTTSRIGVRLRGFLYRLSQ